MALGHTLLSVACRTHITAQNLQQCTMKLLQHYSQDLHNVLLGLITKPPSIYELCAAIAPKVGD